MLSAPSTSLEAGIHALVVASGLLSFGYLIADFLGTRWDLDRVTRWGLALPGAALWAALIMVPHIATGGEVLSSAWIVRGVTLVTAAMLVARKFAVRTAQHNGGIWIAAAAVLVAVIAWGIPVVRMLPLPTDPDTQLHIGWATQLANGESTPSATITGEVPNYYPWLFHGTLALVARFTPGGHAGHALAPLQLLLVAGVALSLFALGSNLGRSWRVGAGTVLFGVLAGGFGTLASWRSYNFAHHNLAPPYPRDLAFALAAGFLLLLVLGVQSRRVGLLVGAGVTLGLVGLSGAAFLVALPVAVLVSLFPIGMSRRVVSAALLLPALAVYGLWLVPIAINYVRLDGFVNITQLDPATLSLWSIVASFGIALPFAAFGIFRAWSQRLLAGPAERVVLALLVAGVVVVAGAGLVPRLLGDAFLTVGRQHRYWPLVYLAVALYAAVGLADLVERVASRSAVVVVVLLVVALLVVPPTLSESFELADKTAEAPSHVLLSDALKGDDQNVFRTLAHVPGNLCVAAVPAYLTRPAFAYTGYRLVLWAGGASPPNRARIRWEEVVARPPTDEQRAVDNRLLTTGAGGPDAWASAVERYGVDLVVAASGRAASPSFVGLPLTPARAGDKSYVIVTASSCEP